MLYHHAFTQPRCWLADHHDFCHVTALVFDVFTPGPSRCPRHGLSNLPQKLKRTFIEAHDWVFLDQRECIDFDDILYAGDKLFIDFFDAPLLLLPRFEFAFLKACARLHGYMTEQSRVPRFSSPVNARSSGRAYQGLLSRRWR